MILPFSKDIIEEDETREVANEFSQLLNVGDVIALKGNLGSGKTFFVKAVCSNYEISNVTSPSFSIVNSYTGKYKVNHFDFYRIKKMSELYDIGINEYLTEEAITFIEWADMYEEIVPKDCYFINIEVMQKSTRRIHIKKNG